MVRVLLAVTEEAAEKNPYVLQLAEGLRAEGLTVRFWNWPAALLGQADVVHIHWPELLYKGKSPWQTVWKSLLTCMLILGCRLFSIPLIWTVHNREPHNRLSRFSKLVDSLLRKNITSTISINDAEFRPKYVRSTLDHVIPHGHYVKWFENYDRAAPQELTTSFVGQVRSYKGVLDLVEAFHGFENAKATLCIAGEPSPSALGEEIRNHASADPRITAKMYFLSDQELVSTVTQSSLVILPYVQMFNSGALLLALSLGRPVLAPVTEINLLMQEEFGQEWVRLYNGKISAEVIDGALKQGIPAEEYPNLTSRNWDNVARLHIVAYKAALRKSKKCALLGKR